MILLMIDILRDAMFTTGLGAMHHSRYWVMQDLHHQLHQWGLGIREPLQRVPAGLAFRSWPKLKTPTWYTRRSQSREKGVLLGPYINIHIYIYI